jgi:hypothetical protein
VLHARVFVWSVYCAMFPESKAIMHYTLFLIK